MAPITFQTRIGLLSHLPGMHYLEIPATVVKKLGGKFRLRLVCTVNGRVRFQCGLVALGQGKAYITLSGKRLKALGLREGSPARVQLELDESPLGVPMPEELEELLRQDREGRARFEKLTDGKKRYLLNYVGAVKNPDKRLERALMLIENLKGLQPGKETFRGMLGKG